QNIIPTTFFKTNTWAAPWLGVIGAIFIFVCGLAYLEWRRRAALKAGEGYGEGHINEPEPIAKEKLVNPWIAITPLVVVGVLNKLFTGWVTQAYGSTYEVSFPGLDHPLSITVSSVAAIWAVEGALIIGILTVLLFAFRTVGEKFAEGSKSA